MERIWERGWRWDNASELQPKERRGPSVGSSPCHICLVDRHRWKHPSLLSNCQWIHVEPGSGSPFMYSIKDIHKGHPLCALGQSRAENGLGEASGELSSSVVLQLLFYLLFESYLIHTHRPSERVAQGEWCFWNSTNSGFLDRCFLIAISQMV